jgi:DNA-binding transcriptional LysR family regulator
MDRLESMSILVAAVEAGSLSAAARRLGTPLATVSRKVSELEGHLKARLLNRTSRRLTLTDAGQSYVAACRRILEQVDEAERAASGEFSAPRGELIVTAPIVFGRLHMLPVATEFLAAYPEIKVRLALADRVVNLMEDHVDVALRIGALPDSSLMATRIGVIRRVVCASPAYFAARGVPKTLADLAAHDCIGFDVLTTAEAWTFKQERSEISVPISARLTVTTAEAVVDAAISGVGIARVLSYQAAQALRDGRLALALVDFEPEPWPVHLVYTGGRMLPLKLRAFLDFAAPRLKARLAESGA